MINVCLDILEKYMTSDGWIDGRFGCAIGCHCYVNQLSSRVNVHVNALMLVMNMSSMYVMHILSFPLVYVSEDITV